MFVNSAMRIPAISRLLSNGLVAELLDNAEIRRRNIDVLEAEATSLEAIGEAMRAEDARQGVVLEPGKAPPNYANLLSQIRGGSRNMGNKLARKVEASMGKAKGWIDQLHEADVSMDGKEAGQIITRMADDERAHWMKMLRLANEANPKKSAASPFGPIPRGGGAPDSTSRGAPKPKRRRNSGGNA